VFLHNRYLLILLLQSSTLYMRPQNLGTVRAVSRNKTIFVFLAKGFSCERPFGKRESYLSYSHKLSDRLFLVWHKPAELHSIARVWNPHRISNSWIKVDCQVPWTLRNAAVRAFLATKTFTAGSSITPAIWHASQSQSWGTSYLRATMGLQVCREVHWRYYSRMWLPWKKRT
jgi:hypothetical protein